MRARWLLHTTAVLLGASALLATGEQIARARGETTPDASRAGLVERLAQRTQMRTATSLSRNIFAASAGFKTSQKPLMAKPLAQSNEPPAPGTACGTNRPCTANIKELKAELQDLRDVMKQAQAFAKTNQTPAEPYGWEAVFYKNTLPLLAVRLEHVAPRLADELKRQTDLLEKPASSDQLGSRIADEQFRRIVAFTENRLQGKIERVGQQK